ncbi:hypothetical protein JAO78_005065 [Alishewanella sp. 16-MA]|uniref:Uncharacterized protein n=1 Tax=Alishewanella maricola TaxID=2795740 RepID=A0ABS8C1I0_9ALTE|nr:hypothetical protein [Alishewanella maricola]MCB5226181.1 hypothetical protein [Alishewanella maricola]
MIHLINFGSSSQPVWRSKLELDLDPDAERVFIADRNDMDLLHHSVAVNNMTVFLPEVYGNGFDIVVIIFDEVGSPNYNAVINDRVRAQLVDARTITTNP